MLENMEQKTFAFIIENTEIYDFKTACRSSKT